MSMFEKIACSTSRKKPKEAKANRLQKSEFAYPV